MAAKRIKKKSFLSVFIGRLIIFIVAIAIPAGAIYGLWTMFKRAEAVQIKKISEELSALPDFSPSETAAEKDWVYPPQKPSKSLEEIIKTINDEIDHEVKKFFPKKDLMREKAEIIKKYRPVREGENIEIQLNYGKGKIRGIFRGREGLTIKIDDRKFKIMDVLEDYRFLFDQPLAEKLASEKCAEFDRIWSIKVDDFKRKKEKELVNKYYPAEGYVKISEGQWKHQSEIIEEYIEKKKKEFISKRAEQEREIFAKNKIWGIFAINSEKISNLKKNKNE